MDDFLESLKNHQYARFFYVYTHEGEAALAVHMEDRSLSFTKLKFLLQLEEKHEEFSI